jgi:hypothetical protein
LAGSKVVVFRHHSDSVYAVPVERNTFSAASVPLFS